MQGKGTEMGGRKGHKGKSTGHGVHRRKGVKGTKKMGQGGRGGTVQRKTHGGQVETRRKKGEKKVR